jgi:hypothetical protein
MMILKFFQFYILKIKFLATESYGYFLIIFEMQHLNFKFGTFLTKKIFARFKISIIFSNSNFPQHIVQKSTMRQTCET